MKTELRKIKNALDVFLIAVVALFASVFAYGIVRYPDAPIHPCGAGQFCGKGNRLHTEQQYKDFIAWEQALFYSFPFGFVAASFLAKRRRRRASQDWERLRVMQRDLSPAIEEQRYVAAWKDLRRRAIAARVFYPPILLWIGWALMRGSVPDGGLSAQLPLAFFALAAGSTLWYLLFRCPRCGNRFFMKRRTEIAERCLHCDLRRGASFEESLAELSESTNA